MVPFKSTIYGDFCYNCNCFNYCTLSQPTEHVFIFSVITSTAKYCLKMLGSISTGGNIFS